jgi:hypothetical protein
MTTKFTVEQLRPILEWIGNGCWIAVDGRFESICGGCRDPSDWDVIGAIHEAFIRDQRDTLSAVFPVISCADNEDGDMRYAVETGPIVHWKRTPLEAAFCSAMAYLAQREGE